LRHAFACHFVITKASAVYAEFAGSMLIKSKSGIEVLFATLTLISIAG
jgi:hypothetical protein